MFCLFEASGKKGLVTKITQCWAIVSDCLDELWYKIVEAEVPGID